MVEKIRRVDFSPDEWIAGTLGLTLAEEGLYMRACALIYSHGGPITVELLRKACFHDHGNRINACLRRLVELGKLIRNGEEIDQKRCRFELEKARKRIGNAQENGAKGGRPKGLAKPDGSGAEKLSLTTNYQPSKKERSPPLRGPPQSSEPTAPPDGVANVSPPVGLEKSNVRGSRLAPDWQPSAADCEFAYARGLDPDLLADQFADYWHAKPGAGGVKLDWPATWRNWCRKTRSPDPRGNRQGDSQILAALSRVRLAGDD